MRPARPIAATAVAIAGVLACGGEDGVTAKVALSLAQDPGIARIQISLVSPAAAVDCGEVTARTCLRDHLAGRPPSYATSTPFDFAQANAGGQTLALRGVAPRSYALVVEGLDGASPPAVVATGCLPTVEVKRPAGGGPVAIEVTLSTGQAIACAADPLFP